MPRCSDSEWAAISPLKHANHISRTPASPTWTCAEVCPNSCLKQVLCFVLKLQVGQVGSILTTSDQRWPNSGQCWPEFDHYSVFVSTYWLKLRPSIRFVRTLLAAWGQVLRFVGKRMARVSQLLAALSHSLANFGRLCQYLANFGHASSTSGRLCPISRQGEARTLSRGGVVLDICVVHVGHVSPPTRCQTLVCFVSYRRVSAMFRAVPAPMRRKRRCCRRRRIACKRTARLPTGWRA